MYASVADLRAEGVTAAEASDARLELLLDEAPQLIDRVTGWFYDPRLLTLRLSGRGVPTIELPAPPIRLDRLMLASAELSLDPRRLRRRRRCRALSSRARTGARPLPGGTAGS